MTRDQLTAAQKAASGATFFPGFFTAHGWGYGMAISTAADDVSPTPGRYGWDGGFGTSWFNDVDRKVVSIVMTQSPDFLFNGSRDQFFRTVYEELPRA
jgi:CubicO group peptidase (beta-lactamase class C family)